MTNTELSTGEHHPAATAALAWVASRPIADLMAWHEAFASCALDGNRLAEVCGGTLDRVMRGEGVGERYILGLCYAMTAGNAKLMEPPKRRGRKALAEYVDGITADNRHGEAK